MKTLQETYLHIDKMNNNKFKMRKFKTLLSNYEMKI